MGIIGSIVVLGFWAAVLFLAARADQPYLEKERAERVFGNKNSHG